MAMEKHRLVIEKAVVPWAGRWCRQGKGGDTIGIARIKALGLEIQLVWLVKPGMPAERDRHPLFHGLERQRHTETVFSHFDVLASGTSERPTFVFGQRQGKLDAGRRLVLDLPWQSECDAVYGMGTHVEGELIITP